jgi:thiol-disulfide isomerase/thioredoxin
MKIFLLSVFVTAYFCSFSQTDQKNTKIPIIKIGDMLPNTTIKVMKNGEIKETNLYSLKGRLKVIDFWATWCGSCLNVVPKLDALQKKYGKRKLNVILVNSYDTDDKTPELVSFLEKWEKKHGTITSTVVVEDSVLAETFPHRVLPHYVWINKKGKVVAITGSQEITKRNISKALADKKLDLKTKEDFFDDDLLMIGKKASAVDYYSVFKRGFIPGLHQNIASTSVLARDRSKGTWDERGFMYTNTPLKQIILNAVRFSEEFNEVNIYKRIFFEGDTTGISDTCTYQFVMPTHSRQSELSAEMMKNLSAWSGFTITIQKRPTRCLALVKLSEEDLIATKGGEFASTVTDDEPRVSRKFVRNISFRDLVHKFEFFLGIANLPIIDRTEYTGKVDMEFDVSSLAKFNQSLEHYKLRLVDEVVDLDVLVITKNNK